MSEDAAEAVDSTSEEDADAEPETSEPGDESGGEDAVGPVRDLVEAETLSEQVAAHDEDLAVTVDDLVEERDELATELAAQTAAVEDLESRLARSRADFQNYKKRAKQQREELRERATEDLIERVTEVRDNLVRALEQDANADIRDGVEATLREFDRVLEDEGVETIDPEPGAAVDPSRHEVMMRVESDQPAGTVADVYRPGYEMGGRVIRTAQVTVSEETE